MEKRKRIMLTAGALLAVLVLSGGLLWEGYRQRTYCIASVPTQAQLEEHEKYQVFAEEVDGTGVFWGPSYEKIKERILSLCRYTGTEPAGDVMAEKYASETLQEHIPLCREITDISVMNGFLYVCYTTVDNHEIYLAYGENELKSWCVYASDSDSALIREGGTSIFYKNFRKGKEAGDET